MTISESIDAKENILEIPENWDCCTIRGKHIDAVSCAMDFGERFGVITNYSPGIISFSCDLGPFHNKTVFEDILRQWQREDPSLVFTFDETDFGAAIAACRRAIRVIKRRVAGTLSEES
jgi:hypothetical protein